VSTVRIALIFTGHGEREALPVLVRRIAALLDPELNVVVRKRHRIAEDLMRKPGELDLAVEQAARLVGDKGGILILADCDWEGGLPCKDAPMLLERARAARPGVPIHLVLANKEYEAWFLAAAESLRGKRGLPADLAPPANPEAIRGAKEWLSDRMRHGHGYAPVTDQPALTALFDFELARQRAPSFDKCYREIAALLQTLNARAD
jgi:hypothetical protein